MIRAETMDSDYCRDQSEARFVKRVIVATSGWVKYELVDAFYGDEQYIVSEQSGRNEGARQCL